MNSVLEQRLKVELGMESSQLFTLHIYGVDLTFGEPLFKHLAALKRWLDIPREYKRLSVYLYAIDGEIIDPKDYMRRYTLCRELRCIPPLIAHMMCQRLERLFPFVDYSKIVECEELFSMFTEVDPPPQTEELFLRYIAQVREKKWYEKFRLLKKALGVLTTSEDLEGQIQESFFIDPSNPNAEPQQQKVRAIEIPLLLGIKPEIEKVLKSRIHVDTNYQYVPNGAYQEDGQGQKLPPVDMTRMSREDFLNTFWNTAQGSHKDAPMDIAPVMEHDEKK